MKFIDKHGNFVEGDSPEATYRVRPETTEGQTLIKSLKDKAPAVEVARKLTEPEVVEEAADVKPKQTRKKRNG